METDKMLKAIVNDYCKNNIVEDKRRFISLEYLYQCLIKDVDFPKGMFDARKIKQCIMDCVQLDAINRFRKICVFELPKTIACGSCGSGYAVAVNVFLGYRLANNSWGIFEKCPKCSLETTGNQ